MTTDNRWLQSRLARCLLLLFLFPVVLLSAGCHGNGGNGPPPPPERWGAIACSETTGSCAYAKDSSTRQGAIESAVALCNKADCKEQLITTSCGALARQTGSTFWEVASGDSIWEAKYKALEACMAGGTTRCEVTTEFCNPGN